MNKIKSYIDKNTTPKEKEIIEKRIKEDDKESLDED